ncbi:hypothetical protein K9N50_13475 [bacterium]|nr:hypothetical protein [bacterium]
MPKTPDPYRLSREHFCVVKLSENDDRFFDRRDACPTESVNHYNVASKVSFDAMNKDLCQTRHLTPLKFYNVTV